MIELLKKRKEGGGGNKRREGASPGQGLCFNHCHSSSAFSQLRHNLHTYFLMIGYRVIIFL